MKKSIYQVITLLFASGLSFAAGAQNKAEKSLADLDLRGSDCILIRTIRDYTPLDDRNLLVSGPGRRAYLVTLVRPAFDLRSSFRLGFSSRDDQLCPFGGDALVFGGLGNEKIQVRSISRLSKEQAEELKTRYGKKKPADITPAEPDAIKGAEVEELD
ncbi:MAG: hypothetical protein HKN35_00420 [Woeseia sp.]|nr:hypothetical protein [Woeseia sp.]MBT8098017.1 hypothetical protein [Woeseia sp.]NNE59341.1 hypothetical protein [Woeseia sp.]NNL55631.1 hypothetical protein [Woeseia sp.]